MIRFAYDDYGSGIVQNVRVSRDGYEWFSVGVHDIEKASLFVESVAADQVRNQLLVAENEALQKQVQDIRSARKAFADQLAEKILKLMDVDL